MLNYGLKLNLFILWSILWFQTLYFNALLTFLGTFKYWSPILCSFVGGKLKFLLSFLLSLCLCLSGCLSFSGSLHSCLPLPVSLSTPMQGLFFSLPLSLLLSHLVTRPLERSVKFPLSQRRGQSEPHKDPQWTPVCSLLPPRCCCSCTHALRLNYIRTLPCLFSFILFFFLPYNSSSRSYT